ncbi:MULTISPECIES: sulfurtransferase [Cobetia]|jgi:thiosulfate/3-mercaptopyruvate sulfurtransferase|uniref:Sulfurtransferase n=1 Tax=Cobetia amphilecti TaxID=1055104 RepID=A0AAP4TYB8_9GAMM|nr:MULTISPECIES: rhodanese-like domain-containing protein [Cobetia]MBR9797815.1 sulfurtransferase [Gammaproteobacteria bacterium]MBF07306.1 thiosulfate sulfurtransferase [Cobetia sp.]MDH2293250.1 rhodanese-like domain-containing protein [Cobetia sp. 1AS1]MDH2420567.1 rhodanese-like domain-containing protein [Cobetia litoralis]MDO6671186.1 rhodanese-like domain-containing protein [Cobetia amphilecti]|tara:strand:- start:14527 stop:15390 length:864 start_codon:yes stop_codon:yes gene_type:complete
MSHDSSHPSPSEADLLPLIVEPQQLAEMLDHPDIVIVDVPLKAESHARHVPGARLLDFKQLVGSNDDDIPGVPSPEALSGVMSALGITRDSHVVAYDDEGGGWAGRLLWTLALLGHTRYSYLNGGLHAWQGDGLPLSDTASDWSPSEYHAAYMDTSVMATREDILDRLAAEDPQESVVVWDARSAEEYRGEKGQNARLGHIPGAVHFEWTEAMDRERNLRIRDYAELVTELGARGLNPEQHIVTHCQSHHRSGLTWLVGQALGFSDVRAYPGSWKEWGNRDDTPIER